jgi:hypothetical protein
MAGKRDSSSALWRSIEAAHAANGSMMALEKERHVEFIEARLLRV